MEKINRRGLLWVMVVLWMVIIFCFSAQPADESAQLSGGIVTTVVNAVVSNFDNLSLGEQASITRQTSFIVRKTAHAGIYAMLGLFTMFALNQTAKTTAFQKIKKIQTQVSLALVICLLYAISDEFHQLFVLGRSCELRDVLIDVTGACVGIIIVWLMINSRRHRERMRL